MALFNYVTIAVTIRLSGRHSVIKNLAPLRHSGAIEKGPQSLQKAFFELSKSGVGFKGELAAAIGRHRRVGCAAAVVGRHRVRRRRRKDCAAAGVGVRRPRALLIANLKALSLAQVLAQKEMRQLRQMQGKESCKLVFQIFKVKKAGPI